jgi:hypothetical protein
VLFFFQFPIQLDGGQEKIETLAFLSEHGSPHLDIFQKSTNTFWWCTPNACLSVINVKHITSVVSMIPRTIFESGRQESRLFLCEKPGLHVACMGGNMETAEEE